MDNSASEADRLLQGLAQTPFAGKSDQAIWLQIADRLARACRDGALRPGDRLPGEIRMAELFGVTRVTMRRALARLQQEGLLQARKGVGIFVRPAFRVDYGNRLNLETMAPGSVISTRTLSFWAGEAVRDEAEALQLTPGAPVLRLTRLRLLDEAPLYLTTKTFPAALFPGFAEAYRTGESVRAVYAAHGISRYRRAETRVTGGFATGAEADALQMTPQTPVLRIVSVNLDGARRAIELNRGVWLLTGVELVMKTPDPGEEGFDTL